MPCLIAQVISLSPLHAHFDGQAGASGDAARQAFISLSYIHALSTTSKQDVQGRFYLDFYIHLATPCFRCPTESVVAGNAAHGISAPGSQDQYAPHYGALLFAINAFSVWHCPNTASMYAEVQTAPRCIASYDQIPP